MDWFRKPTASVDKPWTNYLVWLDQAALADGGDGMRAIDPEGLAYLEAQSGRTWEYNRCARRQWSLFGNNISSAGESSLTSQGSEFMKGMSDSRCTLDFEMNSAGTQGRISNYFWNTYRIPLLDKTMHCTIELNPHFRELFQEVQSVSAQQFETTLRTAAEMQGQWGRTCCPGVFSSAAPAATSDVLVACRPPLTKECALWQRDNWPAAPGFGGYPVYAVAYASSGAWAPIPGAYERFNASMKEIGVKSLCFERQG